MVSNRKNIPLVALPSTALSELQQYWEHCDEGLVKEIHKKKYEWQAYAFSTDDIPLKSLLQFRAGGYYHPDSSYRWPERASKWLQNYFLDFSEKHPNGVCIFQDLCMRPSDFQYHKLEEPGFFIGDILYYLVFPGATNLNFFAEMLLIAGSRWGPFMAFFDDVARFTDVKTSMEFENGLLSIVTVAYDFEGYLLFAPLNK